MFCWHTWHNIEEEITLTFLGVDYTELIDSDFRFCVKCGRIQQYSSNDVGGRYYDISDKKDEIFRDKYSEELLKHMKK